MDKIAFEVLESFERDHWWFRGRREFIAAALRRMNVPAGSSILDVGCGTGGNLELLGKFGRVSAFEFDKDALAVAQRRGRGSVEWGGLPNDLPFRGETFDVICMFDVLEHLDKPVDSLRELAGRLAPGGRFVITVPAVPLLWGPHDEVHQHRRRYTKKSLREHLLAAGLMPDHLTYLNTLLFPLAVLQRLKERLFGYKSGALEVSKLSNEILFRLWMLEKILFLRLSPPIGLSLVAIARAR